MVIARLRSRLERDSTRLQAQYGVARAIAEAESFDEAAPALLESIARPLGRQVAAFWAIGEDGQLRCLAQWHEDGLDAGAFERATRELVLGRGDDLPGQAWEGGRPVWLGDAIASGTFVREEEAEAAGLHGGMAFPVKGGQRAPRRDRGVLARGPRAGPGRLRAD